MLSTTSTLFKALSDSNRLRIIAMLQHRALCVCEITDILSLATSTVSKHLTLLKQAQLITDTKDGKWVSYSLNSEMSKECREILDILPQLLGDDETIASDSEQVQTINKNALCGKSG